MVKQFGYEWWGFVTANLDLEAGFTPNRLQIFKMVDGMGTLEWQVEPNDWEPKNTVWESSTRIKFSRTEREGKETQSAVEFNATDKTWHLVE